jgi:hypothetical protein
MLEIPTSTVRARYTNNPNLRRKLTVFLMTASLCLTCQQLMGGSRGIRLMRVPQISLCHSYGYSYSSSSCAQTQSSKRLQQSSAIREDISGG